MLRCMGLDRDIPIRREKHGIHYAHSQSLLAIPSLSQSQPITVPTQAGGSTLATEIASNATLTADTCGSAHNATKVLNIAPSYLNLV